MKTTTKLAVANIKTDKSRTVLICISIMLTTMLLTVVALIGYGLVKHEKMTAGMQYGEHWGGFVRVDSETFEKIKLHGEFYDVGKMTNFAAVSLEKADGILTYMDEQAHKLGNFTLAEGTFPVKENEIAGQKEFFQGAGVKEPKIGDKVRLSYRVGDRKFTTGEFVISGICKTSEGNDFTKTYGAYVSESFYESEVPETERSYTVVFKMRNDENLHLDEIEEKMEILAGELELNERQLVVNKGYLRWVLDTDWETIGICGVIILMIVLFSVLVIYNIFHVGIVRRIQEYGKLRAIGTTKRQIKNILLKEGMFLTVAGVAAGLLFGVLTAGVTFESLIVKMSDLMPEGAVRVSIFNPGLLLLTAAISFFTVYLSLLKPMRIAAAIAPVEAIRYQEDSANGRGIRKGYAAVNVMRLTMSNLARNRKRTLTTIFTMGLSCVLFVVMVNVVGNMDAEYDARKRVEQGDFYLSLDWAWNDEAYPENNVNHVQQQKLFGKEWLDRVYRIDGVTDVKTRKAIYARRENVGDDQDKNELYTDITVLSREDYQKLKADLGRFDYDCAVKNNEIAYGYAEWMEMDGYAIGDEVELTLFDGDKEIPMTFTLTASARESVSFILTEEQVEAMGFKEDMTSEVFVSCEPDKEPSVRSTIEQMMAENDLYEMVTYKDAYQLSNRAIGVMKGAIYGLCGIIGIIGFMNMANTLIVSIITRKRELGILQAVGMTKKQLGNMLQMEGMVFTIGTLLISMIVGNMLGYLAWTKGKSIGMIGLNVYHVPLAELLVMAVLLLIMQSVLSLVMSRYLQKDTLIERIRHQE